VNHYLDEQTQKNTNQGAAVAYLLALVDGVHCYAGPPSKAGEEWTTIYRADEDVPHTPVLKSAVDAAKNRFLPAIRGALAATPIKGRVTLSGYEGSELLVARLLIESGADVPYVGTACPQTVWSDPDREWLEARGVRIQYRATLEQDIAAVEEFGPDLAIGTTPVVQHAKQKSIPALYFTNLISARPLMGPAGAGSLAQVINGAIANKSRVDRMSAFFEGVGAGPSAGVWEETPRDRPEFKARFARSMAAARAAAAAVGS
jgi:chlorophyllide a reductase subunit Y